MKWEPRVFQSYALKHAIDHPYAGLLLDMGLGKTAIALSTINYLQNFDFSIRKPLIIAPKKVIENTWEAEIEKWDHLRHLTVSKIHGPRLARLEALKKDAHLYLVSRDNFRWLVNHYMSAWPFDMVVVDESSSFKNPKSQRFLAMKLARPFIDRSIIMTGTPIPNGYNDLWSQVYILDQGKRLGEFVEDYRRTYLFPEPCEGFVTQKYSIMPANEHRVMQAVSDIVISMKSEDYLDLPDKIEILNTVTLDDDDRKRYREFEKTQVLKAYEEADRDIAAINAAALTMKLRQFANGAVYENDSTKYQVVHNSKLEALGEIIESLETQGEQVLVAYQFKHDLERLKEKFGGKTFEQGDVERWNNKEYKIMYLQADAGIGLNLQAGGSHIAHFGMNFNLESWLQFNKRIHRLGRTKPVYVHKLLTAGTIDTDIHRAINKKQNQQEAMMEAVKARINMYLNED